MTITGRLRRRGSRLAPLIVFMVACTARALETPTVPPGLPTYHLAQKFAIGGDGGWDYLVIDSDARRLYVSHSKQLEVIDADNGKVLGVIPDLPGIHGVAIAPDLKRGFSSNTGDSSVSVFALAMSPCISGDTAALPVFM